METGRIKNVYSKIILSLIPACEEYQKQSLEIYEQDNFIPEPDMNIQYELEDDFIDEYDISSYYISIKELIEKYNFKPLNINSLLVHYDIVYTKSWTSCGYEYDRILDIHYVKSKEYPEYIFNIKTQKVERKWCRHQGYFEFNENKLKPIKEYK